MHMLYNSDSFVVVRFECRRPMPPPQRAGSRGLRDRRQVRGKGIFIEGALAERFHEGVQALVGTRPTPEADGRLHRGLHPTRAADGHPALTLHAGRPPP
jgi:hypothetical protein